MLKTASYLSSFKNVKIIHFDQFFYELSQVRHGIPQQVADLISRYPVTIQF